MLNEVFKKYKKGFGTLMKKQENILRKEI